MANGLLSSVLGAIDRQKQATKAGFGLLVSNPKEFAMQAVGQYFPTKDEELHFRAVEQAGGDVTQTPYYQKIFGLAQFQGSIKPTSAGKNAIASAKEMLNKPKEGVWNGEKPLDIWKAEQQAKIETEKNASKSGLLPSPQSLSMPSVPTAEQMRQFGRVEVVPLSKAVSFQSARNWEKFNAGKHPGDLVPGFGDKPLALRLETGEYVIYDGNHRTDLALRKGKTELPMHVIDVKSYDPSNAGRKPVPPSMSDDEILSILFGSNKK